MGKAPRGSPTTSAISHCLDAHHYDGGLRIENLAPTQRKTEWIPEPADQYAGFRNEIALGPGDVVVEFNRIAYRDRRITWIAVFQNARDKIFGDRQNHAGVGVWLLEQTVGAPLLLLRGLEQLANLLCANGIAAIRKEAETFCSDYLPTYLFGSEMLPPQLQGWDFAPTPLPETLLLGVASEDASERWELVAEQLIRMSAIADAPNGRSRALILLPSLDSPSYQLPPGVTKLSRGVAADLLSWIPKALGDVGTRYERMSSDVEEYLARIAELDAEVMEVSGQNNALAAQVERLEAEIAESDILQSLSSIRRRLDSIDQRLSAPADIGRRYGNSIQAPASAVYPTQQAITQPTVMPEKPLDLGPSFARKSSSSVKGTDAPKTPRPFPWTPVLTTVLVVCVLFILILLAAQYFGLFGMGETR